jgi:hypothetical protein
VVALKDAPILDGQDDGAGLEQAGRIQAQHIGDPLPALERDEFAPALPPRDCRAADADPLSELPNGALFPTAGAFAQHTVITAHGISTRIVERW